MKIRAHCISALAATGLLAACSSTPESTTYHRKDAGPVGVASAAVSPTVASGLNTTTTTDRVVVGEPASQTTLVGTPSAPPAAGSSNIYVNPSVGASTTVTPGPVLTEEEKRRRALSAPRSPSQ